MKNNFLSFLKSKTGLLIIFLSLLLVYALIFADFFPNNRGYVGHDYSGLMPRFLATYYWFLNNGLFSIPWFSPSMCGGTLLFAHPQDMYFSIPQFLSFLFDPLTATWLSFLVFAIMGFWGFYFLLRKLFACSYWVALLGATLFLFNGFYAYRMVVGHVNFQGFALLPLLAVLLVWQQTKPFNIKHDFPLLLTAALLFSSVFYAAGAHLLLPMGLTLLAIGLIHAIKYGYFSIYLLRLSVFLGIVLLLSAAKLSVAFATLGHLSREAYPLPGFAHLFDAFWVPFKALFIDTWTWEVSKPLFANSRWRIDQHEMEFGITFIPLIFLLIGLRYLWILKGKQWLYFAGLIGILLIPVMVNFYTPEWNHVLKQIPIIKNSSNLVRWYLIYIPVFIVMAMIVFDRLKLDVEVKAIASLVFITWVIAINVGKDKSFYQNQSYDPKPIQQAYEQAKQTGEVPFIRYVAAQVTNSPLHGDDLMAIGVSQINCYEPLFGYRLEFFPQKDKLFGGLVTDNQGNDFNMKNPACYTFPKENSCQAGDHFKLSQKNELQRFTQYLPYDFNMPLSQKVANWVSLVSWFLASLLLLFRTLYIISAKFNPLFNK
jgi:hypothetical protein